MVCFGTGRRRAIGAIRVRLLSLDLGLAVQGRTKSALRSLTVFRSISGFLFSDRRNLGLALEGFSGLSVRLLKQVVVDVSIETLLILGAHGTSLRGHVREISAMPPSSKA